MVRVASAFFRKLYSLNANSESDNPQIKRFKKAELAKIRNGFGSTFEQISSDMPMWFNDYIEQPEYYPKFALVANLYAHHSLPIHHKVESLGKTLAVKNNVDKLFFSEKRFKSIINAHNEEIIVNLRQAISIAKNHEVPIDYQSLLEDLLDWEDNSTVQFRWARDYWKSGLNIEKWEQEIANEMKQETEEDKSKSQLNEKILAEITQARIFAKYLHSLRENQEERHKPINYQAILANLRRGLGKPLGDIDMLPYLAPFLPEAKSKFEETRLFKEIYPAYFLVASLFTLHPHSLENNDYNIGRILGCLARPKNNNDGKQTLQKRFTALLDADSHDIGNHLRQLIALAKIANMPINYRQLLLDLIDWQKYGKSVQRQWAKEYFSELERKGNENAPT